MRFHAIVFDHQLLIGLVGYDEEDDPLSLFMQPLGWPIYDLPPGQIGFRRRKRRALLTSAYVPAFEQAREWLTIDNVYSRAFGPSFWQICITLDNSMTQRIEFTIPPEELEAAQQNWSRLHRLAKSCQHRAEDGRLLQALEPSTMTLEPMRLDQDFAYASGN